MKVKLTEQQIQWDRWRGLAAFGGLLALCGCASMPMIGLPENAPPRPAVEGVFPAVHDVPGPRDTAPLSVAEQTKLEQELSQIRERQKGTATRPVKSGTRASSTAAQPKNN